MLLSNIPIFFSRWRWVTKTQLTTRKLNKGFHFFAVAAHRRRRFVRSTSAENFFSFFWYFACPNPPKSIVSMNLSSFSSSFSFIFISIILSVVKIFCKFIVVVYRSIIPLKQNDGNLFMDFEQWIFEEKKWRRVFDLRFFLKRIWIAIHQHQ